MTSFITLFQKNKNIYIGIFYTGLAFGTLFMCYLLVAEQLG